MSKKIKKEDVNFLSIEKFSKHSGISRNKISELIESGQLIHYKKTTRSGYKVVIPKIANDLLKTVERHKELNKDEAISISIGNFKGGVAKTTNATNISYSLASMGKKVLLLDTDPQANATYSFGHYDNPLEGETRLKDINIISLIDAYANCEYPDNEIPELIEEAIIHIDTPEISGTIDLIPNNIAMIFRMNDLSRLRDSDNILDEVLSYVKKDYDFIIIDTPPRVDTILDMTIMASDYFLVALSPSPFAQVGLDMVLDPLKKMNKIYSKRKNKDYVILGGIMTGYDKQVVIHQLLAENMKNQLEHFSNNDATLLNQYISHSKTINESYLGDGSVIKTDPFRNISYEYLCLTNEILNAALAVEEYRKDTRG